MDGVTIGAMVLALVALVVVVVAWMRKQKMTGKMCTPIKKGTKK